MSKLQVFNNAELSSIPTLLIIRETYFVDKDVSKIMGYERTTKTVSEQLNAEYRDVSDLKAMIDRINGMGVIIFDLATMTARFNNYSDEC